jgi:predicted ATPase
MFIHSLDAKNVLSFGPSGGPIGLKPLNILIGPNGSGKSNLIDIISLLQGAPRDITVPIMEGGGIRDWIWKGMENEAAGATGKPACVIDAVVVNHYDQEKLLRYFLKFTEHAQRFALRDERIEFSKPYKDTNQPHSLYCLENEPPKCNVYIRRTDLGEKNVPMEITHHNQSILSQLKDHTNHPEITYLGNSFGKIRIYREWSFGRYTLPRMPQKADLPNMWLEENCINLGLVLNRLQQNAETKKKILKSLNALYEGIDDYGVNIEGGTVQVFFHEGKFTIPATRLSDGTLRYLCLLAILCNPTPPPLVCIEEPELGLHPDVLSTLAELMIEASQKTQLIVTTHSSQLVDKFTDSPDSVIVCEKHEGATSMKRLDKEALSAWLKDYSLGTLWSMGEIGGNRW